MLRLWLKCLMLSFVLWGTIGSFTVFAKPTGEQVQLLKIVDNELITTHSDYVKGSVILKKSSPKLESNYVAFLVEYQTVRDNLYRKTFKDVFVLDKEKKAIVIEGDVLLSKEYLDFTEEVKDEVGGKLHIKGPLIIFGFGGILLYVIIVSRNERNTFKKGEVYYSN